MSLTAIFLRRLAHERTAAVGLALLVFVTAFALALTPRALERLANEALDQRLAAESAFQRHTLIYETARQLATLPSGAPELDAAWQGMLDAFPGSVRRLVSGRALVVDTPLWLVTSGTELNSVLSLRLHEDAFERLRLVSGRLPSGQIESVPDERPTAWPGQTSNVYEVLLNAEAAEMMGLRGEQLELTTWQLDGLNAGQNLGAILRVVGTYELEDPADDRWVRDELIAGWRFEFPDPNDSYVRSTVLLAPDAYPDFLRGTHGQGLTLLYQWRFFVDTERLDSTQVAEVSDALRRMEGSLPRSGLSAVAADTTMSSGLLRILGAHEAAWRSAETVLAVVGLGALAIALASLAVVTSVASDGRRRLFALSAARGSSLAQLLRPIALESVLLGVPAVVLAVALSMLLIPEVGPLAGAAPAVLAWALLAVLLTAIAVRNGRREAAVGRRSRPQRRASARRLVGEVALIVTALAGAWLLRERGIATAQAPGDLPAADPMLAAVPALVGLAAGLIAMRLYRLPVALLGALAALRRDLLPVLAVRRMIRAGSSALVMLILLVAASVGTFAAALDGDLQRSGVQGAWQEVGADLRLEAGLRGLPAAVDETSIVGVEAAARSSLRSIRLGRDSGWLLVIEPAEYSRVAAGTPADPHLPAELGRPANGQPPTVLAGRLHAGQGELLEIDSGTGLLEVRVGQLRSSFPGLPPGEPFIVIGRDQLAEATGRPPPAPTRALIRGMPAAAEELRDRLAEVAPWVSVVSRAEREAEMLGAPVVGALRVLVGSTVFIALGYAALAVCAALALAAAEQREEVARLRAVGLSRRDTNWLVILEYGPVALLGYVGGVLVGLSLFAFLRPGLGLPAISGSRIELPVTLDAASLVVLMSVIVSILLVGWLVAIAVLRQADPAIHLRRGAE